MKSLRWIALAPALIALASGCGSHGTSLSPPTTSPTRTASTSPGSTQTPALGVDVHYHPRIDPAAFTNRVTNHYFPLTPGTTYRYRGVRDGVPTRHVFTVTHGIKTVMGVRCAVIRDIVTQNRSLVEKTTDWYAQDSKGNVWYFGENTAEYQNGVVTTTAGTWEAGVDHAQPGIVMPAQPRPGQRFRQEYLPGVALDKARILSVNGSTTVPAGTYHRIVVTYDINPLAPSKRERKWYAPGVGFVRAVLKGGGHTETTELVK
jgi:hypothetical protein